MNIYSSIMDIYLNLEILVKGFIAPFLLNPTENIRKPKVYWCFQGDQKRTLQRKGLQIEIY